MVQGDKGDLGEQLIGKAVDAAIDIVKEWAKHKITESPAPAQGKPPAAAPPATPPHPTARLLLLKKEKVADQRALGISPLVLGRQNIDPADATISRQHAEIFFRDGEYSLVDLGSDNGTFLNNHRISSAHTLGHGDRIQIGQNVIVFVAG